MTHADDFTVDSGEMGWPGRGGTWRGSAPLWRLSPPKPPLPAFPLTHISGTPLSFCTKGRSGVVNTCYRRIFQLFDPYPPSTCLREKAEAWLFSGKMWVWIPTNTCSKRGPKTHFPSWTNHIGYVSWSTGWSSFPLEIVRPSTLSLNLNAPKI